MAMCSYQTLARYDDDCSRKTRARTLDDIRTRQRENLSSSRSLFRNLKMIQNRRTLGEYVGSDDDDSDYSPYSPGTDEPDCVPYQTGTRARHETPTCSQLPGWDTDPCNESTGTQIPWFTPAPSPAWSTSTSSATAETLGLNNENHLPSCLFELHESARKSASPASTPGSSSQAENLLLRQINYKNKRLSPRSKSFRDTETIRSNLILLKEQLIPCGKSAEATSQIIHANWQLILDAIQVFDKDVVMETLNFMTAIVGNDLILPETVLHMLQHGLIFGLADTVSRLEEGPLPAVRLLQNIARSTPAAIPYMIDLVYRSNLLEDLAKFINTGYNSEAQTIIEFYHYITDIIMNQIFSGNSPQPLVPKILLLTGISKDTVESYGPVATMEKCLSPNLLMNSITKSFSRSNIINADFINVTFLLLANALKLIHILSVSEDVLPKYMEFVVRTLCCFRDSRIESHLTSVARGLERKIHAAESSDHCSQGVGVDSSAAATLTRCRLFTSFYQQYYGSLSNNFSQFMSKVQPSSPVKSNTSWSLCNL